MKGFSGFQSSPIKDKPSFDLKGWTRGEQGLIPDYKGESTRETIKKYRTKGSPYKPNEPNPYTPKDPNRRPGIEHARWEKAFGKNK